MKKTFDTPFLLVLIGLVIFGLLIFTSAALGLLARDGASFSSVTISQLLLGLVCGGIAMFVLARVDYRLYKPYTPYFFAFAVFLTLLTFVPHVGLSLKGASRWIEIGPFTFQPAELLKCAAIMFLAAMYAAKYKTISTLQGGLLPLLSIVGGAALVMLLQPDTDGVVILSLAAGAMFFAGGGRVLHMGILVGLAVLVLGFVALERPYLLSRFDVFLHQNADPQGAGWQIQQSLISVGSGGLTGKGFGQSVQKFSYLPEPIGDSIFAVAAEEFGFIGSSVLVILYVAFAMLGLRIAARAADPFGGLLVVGFVILIIGQSFFNMASTLGLIPVSGLPLIFVSHGGSALAISLAEAGIILSVSRRMRQK